MVKNEVLVSAARCSLGGDKEKEVRNFFKSGDYEKASGSYVFPFWQTSPLFAAERGQAGLQNTNMKRQQPRP